MTTVYIVCLICTGDVYSERMSRVAVLLLVILVIIGVGLSAGQGQDEANNRYGLSNGGLTGELRARDARIVKRTAAGKIGALFKGRIRIGGGRK